MTLECKDLRVDGRFSNELRDVNIQFECIENRGYVVLSQGCTTIRTYVSKNKEKKQLSINLVFSQICRNESLGERKVYEMKHELVSIFETLIPNENQIEVNVEILQDNGSLFSAIVNSISLAFCYNGISTTEMCVSLTLNEFVDLCHSEENKNFSICIVLIPVKNEILFFESFGRLQKGELLKCLEMSKVHCEIIHNLFKKELASIAS